jgi:tRNA 2-selenouridine synthase
MIAKTGIDVFLELAQQHPVLDVRSPGEYAHAHIPGAYSMPLFTDEERKVVGTAYKQQSREIAIKIGLDYFGSKMRRMVEETESLLANSPPGNGNIPSKTVLVHCWRGGMRSAGVAWLLDLYGFKVYTLAGGYKAYRTWTLSQFIRPYPFQILGGFTGSGKTEVLYALRNSGAAVIDLEGLAHHKGSAFGGLGMPPKPSQEMFENSLALSLYNACKSTNPIWLEDESRRIGNLNIPEGIWKQMRASRLYFLEIPAESRLDYIVAEYGKFKKEELINAIVRVNKRLGGLATKQCINYLVEDNHKECFRILLSYYDKSYFKGMHERENLEELLVKIPAEQVNAKINAGMLTAFLQISTANL